MRKEIGAQKIDKQWTLVEKIIKRGNYHHVYMVLQEKEVSIWEYHHIQSRPVLQWRYVEIGFGLLGDLLSSGQLYVCQRYAYY